MATGKSLTESDILSLKNEFTISMNSIVKITSKINWEPSYYVIQDIEVFDKLKNDINKLRKAKILSSHILQWKNKIPKNYIKYPHNFLDHLHSDYKELNTNFSFNSFKEVFDGYTVAYSCLQLACYLGFKEIYLLGFDADYKKNFKENNIVFSGKYDPTYLTAGKRINFAFNFAEKIIDKKNIKVFNVTKGGEIRSFYSEKFS